MVMQFTVKFFHHRATKTKISSDIAGKISPDFIEQAAHSYMYRIVSSSFTKSINAKCSTRFEGGHGL